MAAGPGDEQFGTRWEGTRDGLGGGAGALAGEVGSGGTEAAGVREIETPARGPASRVLPCVT
jgi:hypothetical protein